MSTTLYEKRGRKYVVWGDAKDWSHDRLRAGQFRLEFCPRDGSGRYTYNVTPMTAPFLAAAEIARDAMEQAMHEAAKSKLQEPATPYTKRQRKLIDQFRADMVDAGGFVPTWWQTAMPHEISQAGIDAVLKWGEE